MRRAIVGLSFLGLLWGILLWPQLGCNVGCIGGTGFPTIISVFPNPVSAFQFQSGGFLIVNGSNFLDGSVVSINGVGHPTAFVNGGQLRVTMFPVDVVPGQINIIVNNPQTFGGGLFLACQSSSSSGIFGLTISD